VGSQGPTRRSRWRRHAAATTGDGRRERQNGLRLRRGGAQGRRRVPTEAEADGEEDMATTLVDDDGMSTG
jgi:hypothetical protein